jgi:hypothetical protein
MHTDESPEVEIRSITFLDGSWCSVIEVMGALWSLPCKVAAHDQEEEDADDDGDQSHILIVLSALPDAKTAEYVLVVAWGCVEEGNQWTQLTMSVWPRRVART